MKNILKLYPILFAALLLVFGACDEEPTDDLYDIIKKDLGYVPKITQFKLISPTSTSVPAQSTLSFDLRYFSEGTIDNVAFYMLQGETETLIAEQDYAPAYSSVTKTDSLIFSYAMPASLTSGSAFSVQARVANVGVEEYPTKSAAVNFTVQ